MTPLFFRSCVAFLYLLVAVSLIGSVSAQETAGATAAPKVYAGSAEAGAGKAAVCMACHGQNGNSVVPEWPSIAGQNAVYLREQLTMFRDRKRVNEVMWPIAQTLTDEDIADLAAYYSTQTPAGLEADPSYWQAGQALYRAGDRARGIPSCAACHGPAGKGNPAAGYPALRAQHSVYTAAQLQAYANATRYEDASDPANVRTYTSRNGAMMITIAKRLSAEDMRNLASYIQGMR
jgi:cytochrome c553